MSFANPCDFEPEYRKEGTSTLHKTDSYSIHKSLLWQCRETLSHFVKINNKFPNGNHVQTIIVVLTCIDWSFNL